MRLCEILLITLVSAVVFVNGWTDAPNAITGVVATKTMSYRAAVTFAAVCNLSGLLVMGLINSSVAGTVTSLADFGGADSMRALAALLAAMASVAGFSTAAWFFGIPTSESHALAAALSGASIALSGAISAESFSAWKKVLAGLFLSLIFGFLLGRFFTLAIGPALKSASGVLLVRLQIIFAGGMAFMHGAQDGQKFTAVFVVAGRFIKSGHSAGPVNLREHMPALLLCAAVMALGTSVGGKRIIDTVGTKMAALEIRQSVAADLGGGACLLFASLMGVPISTTHVKTAAIAGAVTGRKNPAVIGEMLLAWGITFPVCAVLGFVFTRLGVSILAGS